MSPPKWSESEAFLLQHFSPLSAETSARHERVDADEGEAIAFSGEPE